MKPIILALVPLLLLVSCTDTSDLEDRISQLEQQNTQLEKEEKWLAENRINLIISDVASMPIKAKGMTNMLKLEKIY